MRLKPSLKTLARPALLFSFSFLLAALSGCSDTIQATYKEKDIPAIIKKICKDEYGLEVTTTRTDSTIWTYAPLDKILHEEYGKKEGKIFDEELLDKLRHMITTIGRVLISSDNTPDFYVLAVSDIKMGIDYTLIGSALDMKKSFADFIPWTEANRRYVIKLQLASDAIGDKTGAHIKTYNIKLPDFLADQIAQRMGNIFQEEELKDYYQVEKTEGRYEAGAFYFDYQIKEVKKPPQEIDIKKRLIDVASYCIRSYDFKNFTTVNLMDLTTQNKWDLNNAAIWQRPSVL